MDIDFHLLDKSEVRRLAQIAATKPSVSPPSPKPTEVEFPPPAPFIHDGSPIAVAVQCSPVYSSQLAILLKSLQKYATSSPVTVYCYDGYKPTDYAGAIVQRRSSADIGRDRPGIIREMIDRHQRVCFLGADTELFQPLDKTDSFLSLDHDLILCQHYGYIHEHCNADFQLWRRSQRTDALLAYYQAKVSSFGTEQDCLNHIVGTFPGCRIWRSQTYNVAACNVQQTNLRHDGTQWITDEGPLVLFHYSGFMRGNPDRMSCYYHGPDVTSANIRTFYRRYGKLLAEMDARCGKIGMS